MLALFGIRSGEGRIVALFLIHSFFIGMAKVFADTAALTLFLDRYEAADLPFMYILSTIVIVIIGLIYTQLEKRLRFRWLLITNLLFTFGALIIFRLLFVWTEAAWPAMVLAIGIEAMWVLNSLEFWGLANRSFNVRQAKRLFGFIGSGEVVAVIAGGFAVAPLLQLFDTPNLLLLSAIGITGALTILLLTLQFSSDQAPSLKEDKRESHSIRALFKERYVVLIFILAALSVSALYFSDNIFSISAEQQYPNPNELAAFLGAFYGIAGIFQLVSRAVLSGLLINRYGVMAGLLALPLALTMFSASAVGIAEIFGRDIPLLFWLIMLVKLADKALRYTVNQSANLVLYQPFSPQKRIAVQVTAESIVEAIAGVVTGVILLALTNFLNFGAIELLFILLFVLLGWIVSVVFINREYAQVLVQALAKRKLVRSNLVLDNSSIQILVNRLQSPHAGEVIYALDTLEAAEHPSFLEALSQLCAHPAPEVRAHTLRKIASRNLSAALPAVQTMLEQEESPYIKGIAIETLAQLEEVEALDDVLTYLDAEEREVQIGALVGLLRSGGIEGVLAAGERFLSLENSTDAHDRALAAQILGQVGISSFYRPLIKLLQDEDLNVRREAIIAASKVQNPRLWPIVIQALYIPELANQAVQALIQGGDQVLPHLQTLFDADKIPRPVLIHATRACGEIGGDGVIQLLHHRIGHPDEIIRYHILAALNAAGYQAEGIDARIVYIRLREELKEAVWTLYTATLMASDERFGLLSRALQQEFSYTRRRILFLLSLLYDQDSANQIEENILHPIAERRAYALEILDVLLEQEFKPLVLPLFEESTPARQLERLLPHMPQENGDVMARYEAILTSTYRYTHAWTRACALYIAPQFENVDYSHIIVSALKNTPDDPLIQETALWALYHIAPGLYRLYTQTLNKKPDDERKTSTTITITKTIAQIERFIKGGRKMLITVELVMLLKTVSIFAETPEDLLAEVAGLLEELDVPAGTSIIRKGEHGDCMYIIASGEVRVHDGEHTIIHLGERDVVGEMALLDAEPRNADVTASQDSVLLKLNQDAFYELLSRHPEVTRGILKVLARRLRAMTQHAD